MNIDALILAAGKGTRMPSPRPKVLQTLLGESMLTLVTATLHSMPRIVWEPIEKMGDYLVSYADGTAETVPVKYAENIMAYQTAYAEPMHQEFYRHNGYVGTWFIDSAYQGKDRNGDDMTVGGFVWENPHPEREIAAITYRPMENDYCRLILAGLRGWNPR